VIYLLDVNALLALAHAAHVHHARTERWVAGLKRSDRLATCSITELGFVRVAPQARLSPSVSAAREHLAMLTRAKRPKFVRLADALGAEDLPPWVRLPAQTTDGHLVALAEANETRLVTLDGGIPDAMGIPDHTNRLRGQ
jgi:toxin-antitoxin system PIN domain toxin